MTPRAYDFENRLRAIIKEAEDRGDSFIDVISGQLHKEVGGYPGRDHRMPACVEVMKRTMNEKDRILDQPPSGKGASLKIRYFLPH